jgi:23S rRNA pseudouridine1911/1915/1917 synthase
MNSKIDQLEELIDITEINEFIISDEYIGMRVDATLAKIIDNLSRTKITQYIKEGLILINNKLVKPKDIVFGGEIVTLHNIPENNVEHFIAEDIKLDIVYQDEDIIVINKPAGLVTHPGNGNWNQTLLNGLLFHFPELKSLPRAGIIHRLDKDTTGLLVVAKTMVAYLSLVSQLQQRTVNRIYRTIVEGAPHKEGVVKKNIGRDPQNRLRMKVLNFGGKEAITYYRVLQYFDRFSYVECKLMTGRTHQIRVHMKSIGHPIVGDLVYNKLKTNYEVEINDAIILLNRQALHATKLSFVHPVTQKIMNFKIPLPNDFKYLLQVLYSKENQDIEYDEDFDSDSNWEIIYQL